MKAEVAGFYPDISWEEEFPPSPHNESSNPKVPQPSIYLLAFLLLIMTVILFYK